MVDPIGIFVLLVAGFFMSGIFIGFYIFEDFTGLIIGVALATAVSYLGRSIWLGLASNVVGGG